MALEDHSETVICFRWLELNQQTASYFIKLSDALINENSLQLLVVNNYDRCCIGNLHPATEFEVEVDPLEVDPPSSNIDYQPITVATSK